MVQGKKILLGVTGSIAAYKAAMLVRLLIQQGATVKVIMTKSASDFVTPLTFATLSKSPVEIELYDKQNGNWANHVELGGWADAFVIAPATANTISKMAHGQCDSLLLTTYLSATCPVFVAPAMDLDMLKHPATAANLAALKRFGNHILRPGFGELASGLIGDGRMAEPEQITETLHYFFLSGNAIPTINLSGKKILITAGPTYEAIDPVRFIGNHSSGKMGFALAQVCAQAGANVTLVTGPTHETTGHSAITRIDIISAAEMFQVCHQLFPSHDVLIMSAAVADYKPAHPADQKIKKGGNTLAIELEPTQDILSSLAAHKQPHQRVIGFALETQNALSYGHDKLTRKKLDAIVINSLTDPGAGFGTKTNKITIIQKDNKTDTFELKDKTEVAMDIVRTLFVNGCLAFLFAFFASFLTTDMQAQELNCKVQVLTPQIQGDKHIYETLQKSLFEFLTNTHWTKDNFKSDERIDCTFLLTINARTNDDFTATLQVQSSRPIYKTSYNAVLLNYNDPDITFRYVEYQPLDYSESAYMLSLTSIFAFYADMIIALDYDTFSPNGGTPFYQKALSVLNFAQSDQSVKGWQPYDNPSRNRYWMVTNALDPLYAPIRECAYKYHRQGLDLMVINKDQAKTNLSDCLSLLQKAYKDRPASFSLQLFFNAKADEMVNLYTGYESGDRTRIAAILSELDPSNSTKYLKITASN